MNGWVNAAAVVGFFGGLVFCLTYAAVPWWRSSTGVNLMLVSGGATALFGLRCLGLLFGEGFPGQDLIRFVFLSVVGAGLWWRWWLLVRAQLATARTPADPNLPEGQR